MKDREMKNMIIVVECTTITADRDRLMYEIMHAPSLSTFISTREDPYKRVEVVRETILGKVFHLPNGERLVLGLSDAVSKSLCVPFEVIENQQKEIESLHKMECGLRKRVGELATIVDGYMYSSFWKRLMYLFNFTNTKN